MTPQAERQTLAELIRRHRDQDAAFVLLEPDETATALDVRPKTLEAWRREGKGPAFVKVGRYVRYRLSSVIAFVDAQTFATTRGGKAGAA